VAWQFSFSNVEPDLCGLTMPPSDSWRMNRVSIQNLAEKRKDNARALVSIPGATGYVHSKYKGRKPTVHFVDVAV